MQTQTTMKHHHTPVGMAIYIIKKTRDSCWQEYGEKGTLYTVGGNVNLELPQKIENRNTPKLIL